MRSVIERDPTGYIESNGSLLRHLPRPHFKPRPRCRLACMRQKVPATGPKAKRSFASWKLLVMATSFGRCGAWVGISKSMSEYRWTISVQDSESFRDTGDCLLVCWKSWKKKTSSRKSALNGLLCAFQGGTELGSTQSSSTSKRMRSHS